MKMQESQISVVPSDLPEGQPSALHLSGPLSEWLFATRFWADINAKCGTMFDQYEEDEAATPVVEAIAEALEGRVQSLQVSDAFTVEFVYGWASDNEPLTASVQRGQLLSELTAFHDFLVNAVAESRCLSFSL